MVGDRKGKRKVGQEDNNSPTQKRNRWDEEMMDASLKHLPRLCPVCGSGKPHILFKMFANHKLTQPRYKCTVCPREFTLNGRSYSSRRPKPSQGIKVSEASCSQVLSDDSAVDVGACSDEEGNEGETEGSRGVKVSVRYGDDDFIVEEYYTTDEEGSDDDEESESSFTDGTDSESSDCGESESDGGGSSHSGESDTESDQASHVGASLPVVDEVILDPTLRW